MTVDRKRLRELALAAFAGPWRVMHPSYDPERTRPDFGSVWQGTDEATTGTLIAEFCQLVPEAHGRQRATIDFIAAANPQTILELLDALEAPTDDARMPREPTVEQSMQHTINEVMDRALNSAERADALGAALQLVVDLAAREWQEPDGSRRAAKDNFGERLWFISDAVMREARNALAAPSAPKEG